MARFMRMWWGGDRWPRCLRWLGYMWIAIAFCPLLALILGYGPLVLVEPAVRVVVASMICCLIGTVLLIPLIPMRAATTASARVSRLVKHFIGAPVMLIIGGYSAAIARLPLTAAVLIGGPTKVVLNVEAAFVGGGGRGCSGRVLFSDLMPPFDRICRLPLEASTHLESGMVVVVKGWGTNAVMIAREVRLAHP